jgi:prepilin-type N-terminal cleavage/methylation domain-containing protein
MKTRKGFTLIELLVVIAIIAILAAILFPVFAQARDKARQTVCLSNEKQIGLAAMMYMEDYDEMWVPYSYGVSGPGLNSFGFGAGNALIYWVKGLDPYTKNRDVFLCPNEFTYLWYGLQDDPTTAGVAACPSCRKISYTWNAIGTNGSDDSSWCNGVVANTWGWPGASIVDPSFQPQGKTGFTVLPSSYWTASPVPDAYIEDHAGTIWLTEGVWPDLDCDNTTDYGWVVFDNGRLDGQYRGYHVRDRHSQGFNAIYGEGHVHWVRWGTARPEMYSVQQD